MSTSRRDRLWVHFGLLLAEAICIPAFIIETYRAIGGNTLSWAYVVEWPILGSYAVYMWRKLLRDTPDTGSATAANDEPDDPDLVAWNAYLQEVHKKPVHNEDGA